MPKNPHADFSPALEGYSGQGTFRFWCQMALPLTYDDSLSYYELLCKVVNYLNNTIEDVADVETNVNRLSDAYTQLQNYVNDYFDDLDVEAELRNVLDAMAEDGSLDDLLDPLVQNHLPSVVDDQIDDVVADQIGDAVAGQIDNVVAEQLPPLVEEGIPNEVSDWLTENVNPVGSAVVVDSSLTISGAAADAKVTGDKLAELKTQLNAIEIGVPVDTASALTTGRYFFQYNPIGNTPTIDTSAGKNCTIDIGKARGGGSIKIIIDSLTANNTIASLITDGEDTITRRFITSAVCLLNTETNKYEWTIVPESNEYKIYFSIYGGSDSCTIETSPAYSLLSVYNETKQNTEDINELTNNFNNISMVQNLENLAYVHERLLGGWYQENASYLATKYFPVIGGSTVTVKTAVATNTVGYEEYDANFNFIQGGSSDTNNAEKTITLSPYTRYMRICWLTSEDIPSISEWFKYNGIGIESDYISDIINVVRTSSDSTYFYGTFEGDFKANDVLTFYDTSEGEMTPNLIQETGHYTVNCKVLRTATGQYSFPAYIKRNLIITHNHLVSIDVSTTGDDASNSTVKTLKRAIDSGAKYINLKSNITDGFDVTDKDIIVNGNGNTIYGDIELTTETYNTIKRATYTADDLITACYVNQTTALKETVSGSSWKGDRFNIACYCDDTKLEPFATIADVEAHANSFCWNNGYFYINASGTRYSYVVKSKNNFVGGNVVLNDVKMMHYMWDICSMKNGHIEANSCVFSGSVNMNALYAENSTLHANKCECTLTWNDGINCHGRGESTIIDCYCHDCSDDGISQHDATEGTIIGGEYCRNLKGGVSSPINRAKVNIYNAWIHDNMHEKYGYGIYAAKSASDPVEYRIFNCVITGNRIGIDNAGHYAKLYGNYINGNTTNVLNQMDGTVTYLDQ